MGCAFFFQWKGGQIHLRLRPLLCFFKSRDKHLSRSFLKWFYRLTTFLLLSTFSIDLKHAPFFEYSEFICYSQDKKCLCFYDDDSFIFMMDLQQFLHFFIVLLNLFDWCQTPCMKYGIQTRKKDDTTWIPVFFGVN